jgi:UDP-N-acetylglucosamine 3-dehydrogenase
MTIGLIGLGNMGQIHLRVLKELQKKKKIDRILVYDENPDLLDIYSDISIGVNSLIEISDGIIIATPTDTHFGIAKKIMDQEKPFLVEKPATLDEDELGILKNYQNCMTGFVERFNPAVTHLKRMLNDPLYGVGKIFYIAFERVNNVENYKRKREGIIYDVGIHDFDLSYYLFRLEEFGYCNPKLIDDGNKIVFALVEKQEDSILYSFKLSWIDETKRRMIKVYGEDGVIICDLIEQEIKRLDRKNNSIFSLQEKTEPILNELDYFINHYIKKEEDMKYYCDDSVGVSAFYKAGAIMEYVKGY